MLSARDRVPRPMIIGQKRHRRREVKRLTQPLGRSKKDELVKFRERAVAAQITLQNTSPAVINSRRENRSTR